MHRFNKFYMYPLAFTFNPIQFPSFWIIELLNLTLISTKKLISLTFLFVLFINLTVTNPYCPSDTSSTRPYLSQLSRPRTQHVPLYALVCTRACTRGPDTIILRRSRHHQPWQHLLDQLLVPPQEQSSRLLLLLLPLCRGGEEFFLIHPSHDPLENQSHRQHSQTFLNQMVYNITTNEYKWELWLC